MTKTLDRVPPEQMEVWQKGGGPTKIRWTHEEQMQVLAGTARVLLKHTHLPLLQAVRLGQSTLPQPRHREIPSITTPPWAWLRDAIDTALQWARDNPEDEGSAPSPEPPPLTPPAPVVPSPVPPPVVTEQESQPGIRELLDALERDRLERARQHASVEGLLTQLLSELVSQRVLLSGGFRLVPAGAGPVAPPAPVVSDEALPVPVPALAAPVAPPVPPVAPAPPRTRKPRVVVLSIESGHVKYGVKEGTKGSVERLELWDTPRKPTDFSAFDYVVTTKWTSVEWSHHAKLGEKQRHAPGGAEQIAKYIRALPEITVEKK